MLAQSRSPRLRAKGRPNVHLNNALATAKVRYGSTCATSALFKRVRSSPHCRPTKRALKRRLGAMVGPGGRPPMIYLERYPNEVNRFGIPESAEI